MIPHRTGREERPEAANNREEVGHWEVDTAVSRQSKTAIMVLQEPKLGMTIIEKCLEVFHEKYMKPLSKDYPIFLQNMRKTMTYDNGQENGYHMELHKELGVKTYICNPYSSWEKGSVENAIGLPRKSMV